MANNDNKGQSGGLPGVIASAGRFRHEAMGTFFHILTVYDEYEYACQAANAAFAQIDRIESNLSRFVENSDISRINNLMAGQTIPVGLETFECLSISKDMYHQTSGAFDITVGALYECWLDKDRTLKNPTAEQIDQAKKRTGMDLVRLNEDDYTVTILADNVSIDPGGIGKGFALDKAAGVLRDWSIETAFVHSGGSTIVATGKPEGTGGWPVTMSLPERLWKSSASETVSEADKMELIKKLELHDIALSGSNLEYGMHVIDPETAEPVKRNVAAWATAESGAVADALSTALLVMTETQAKKYFAANPAHRGIAISPAPQKTYKKHLYGSKWQ